ncbi:MAG: KilA-N domain-containing protein [Pontiellaceae bacterium]|nr:KilA-N domain-containing protein [Pontiellaceae bacterium]
MKATINANGTEITVLSKGDENDYISLTDIARYKNPDEPKDVIKNWMRNRSTIEFLGLWEELNNPGFKGVEFDTFKNEAELIKQEIPPRQRLVTLNKMAIEQMTSILKSPATRQLLEGGE